MELLRAAGPYAADTVQYRFTYKQDTVRAREIREYFRLDTLVNPAATTWDNARALAQFVARIRKSTPKRATQSDCGSIPVP